MQDWTELTITVPTEKVDVATDIANMVVPYGVYIEDYSNLEEAAWEIAHIDLIDEELLARDRTKAIIHIYISPEENPAEALAFLSERLTAEGIEHTLGSSQVCEDDWANNWKKYFKPLPVGEKLIISPTWEPATETDGRAVLSIDPGMAFGTGGHGWCWKHWKSISRPAWTCWMLAVVAGFCLLPRCCWVPVPQPVWISIRWRCAPRWKTASSTALRRRSIP